MSSRTLSLSLLLLFAGPLALAQTVRVCPDVRHEVMQHGRATVCVVLDDVAGVGHGLDTACRRIGESQNRLLSGLPAACEVRYRYRYSPVVLLDVDDDGLRALENAGGVRRVCLDERGSGALVQSKAAIDADRLGERLGLTGEGRVVAVLDSGLDTDHPDFEDAVVHEYHFLDRGAITGPGAEDEHGHGTNVTGIIASRGRVAAAGVAPRVSVVVIKVLDRFNRGWVSDWAVGVEYVVDLHREDNGIFVDAINMSLASGSRYADVCDDASVALAAACRVATEVGIMVIAATGNRGDGMRISSPACLSSVVAVGSVPDDAPDRLSSFTNRNHRLDFLAPGETVTSSGIGGGLSDFQGTSQATPHVAAIATLMREAAGSSIRPDQIYDIMRLTGVAVHDSVTGRDFVLVNARAALQPLVRSGDCDGNGILDFIDTRIDQTLADGNGDGVPDFCEALFFRGDPSGDGDIDIVDVTSLLDFLYLGAGGQPDCLESADANNDGIVDVSDVIRMLYFLFHGGPPPPDPGPPGGTCGRGGDLGCAFYDGCPV